MSKLFILRRRIHHSRMPDLLLKLRGSITSCQALFKFENFDKFVNQYNTVRFYEPLTLVIG
jgi:hypothetical protein